MTQVYDQREMLYASQQQERRNRQKLKLKSARPKAWSHQDDLKALVGKMVTIEARGQLYYAQLVEADQFTVKIRRSGSLSDLVLFKSVMTSFREGQ